MGKYFIFIFLINYCISYTPSTPTISYKFNWVNFTFETTPEYHSYINNDTKNYTECIPAGIKLNSKSEIFISTPRFKGCYPATLSKMVNADNNIALLRPFPDFAGNEIGNVTALQSVLGFEIDQNDDVWALDQGRINDSIAVKGSIKLNKYTASGDLIISYDLSDYVSLETSFLNDLVVDIKGGFVYITDSGIPINGSLLDPNPAIIVVNVNTGEIYRVLENHPSVQADPTV